MIELRFVEYHPKIDFLALFGQRLSVKFFAGFVKKSGNSGRVGNGSGRSDFESLISADSYFFTDSEFSARITHKTFKNSDGTASVSQTPFADT